MTVPKLRFPGFSEAWQQKRLGDIAQLFKGANISKGDIDSRGKTEAVRYGELYTRYGEVIDKVRSKTNLDPKQLVLSKKNDVIIPASGETHIDIATASCVLRDNVALSGDINIIRSNNDGIFLAYYLSNAKRADIAKIAQGVSVVHLYSTMLKSLRLNLPDVEEQKKIAALLLTINKKLDVSYERIKLLKKYRNGVIQKIFTQEVRFKGDGEKGSSIWEVKKFSDVYNFLRTNSFSREQLGTDPGGIKNIHYGDIHTYLPTQVDVTKVPLPVIKNRFQPKHEDEYCRVGDVIIADASEDYVDIGKCVELIKLGDEKVVAGLHTFLARPKPDKVAIGFSSYALRSGTVRKQVMRIATGVSVLGVSKSNLSKVTVPLPSLEEQKKITGFLMTIDDKIKIEESKLNQAKQFKKALLQQMFV